MHKIKDHNYLTIFKWNECENMHRKRILYLLFCTFFSRVDENPSEIMFT